MNAPPPRPSVASVQPLATRPTVRPRRRTAPRSGSVYVALEPARDAPTSAWRWVVTMVSPEPLPGWWRVDVLAGDPVVRIGDRAAIDPIDRRAVVEATIAAREAWAPADPKAEDLGAERNVTGLAPVFATWADPDVADPPLGASS